MEEKNLTLSTPEILTPQQPEQIIAPEKEAETETQKRVIERPPTTVKHQITTPVVGQTGIAGELEMTAETQKRKKEIEDILASELVEIYTELPQSIKSDFKRKGEETISLIYAILNSTKVSTQKIIDLIKDWLMIIPGVNKFFVEQAAKIKTDELIKLKK